MTCSQGSPNKTAAKHKSKGFLVIIDQELTFHEGHWLGQDGPVMIIACVWLLPQDNQNVGHPHKVVLWGHCYLKNAYKTLCYQTLLCYSHITSNIAVTSNGKASPMYFIDRDLGGSILDSFLTSESASISPWLLHDLRKYNSKYYHWSLLCRYCFQNLKRMSQFDTA